MAEAARALNAAFGNVVSSLIGWTRETMQPCRKEHAQAKEPADNEKPENRERKRPARPRSPEAR